mgnify:CR=1 FL=1
MNDIHARVRKNNRKLRIEKGYSQEELADLSDLHRTYIGQVERGEKNLTLRSLERIANALKVSMKNLLYINVCENILSEEAILNILKVLNKNGLTLGWCYLDGGANATIYKLNQNMDYLMLKRKRWNITINTNN